jgi:hypothetical protein
MNLPPPVHVSGLRPSKRISTYRGIDPVKDGIGHACRVEQPRGMGMEGEQDNGVSSSPGWLVGINRANGERTVMENLVPNLAS